MPLTPGSSALDAGNATYCPALDQRRVARIDTCDIGAFEARGFTLTYTGGDLQTAPVSMAFPIPLQAILTETGGFPLPGATVSFTGPQTGAGIAPAVLTATTDANGQAQAIATANGAPGIYIVSAGIDGLAPVERTLTNLKADTTTSLEFAPNPSDLDETVIFTAIVTSGSPGVTPAGTVSFYEQQGEGGSMALAAEVKASEAGLLAAPEEGELPPESMIYTFSTSSLESGVHAMVAVYSGDDLTAGSTSNTVEQTVRSGPVKVDSTTALTSAPNPSNYHQKVTFTAAVTGSAGTPTGTVTFYENPAGDSMQGTEAAAGNPAPTVQWQVSTDAGFTWANITGATSTTYSFTADASQGGYQYLAVFTNDYSSATTSAATLTVSTVLSIRVASLAGSSVWTKPNALWQARVVVTLTPAGEGALVTGAWSIGAAGTCTITGGSCPIVLSNISRKVVGVD